MDEAPSARERTYRWLIAPGTYLVLTVEESHAGRVPTLVSAASHVELAMSKSLPSATITKA